MADPYDYAGGYDSDLLHPADFGSAALSVGVMIAVSAVFLALLKKSGFRAMVAVGRS